MPAEKSSDTADINQYLPYQRRVWVFQRVGWVVIAILLVCDFAGLLGQGPWARATIRTGQMVLEYPRYARSNAPAELQIDVAPERVGGGPLRIALNGELVREHKVKNVTPRPKRVEIHGDWQVYEFDAVEASGLARVKFELQPEYPGWISGEISLNGGSPVHFHEFVYP